MDNLRIRLMTLALLGVGLAGGGYLLNGQSGNLPPESPATAPLPADSSSTPAGLGNKSPRFAPGVAETEEQESEVAPPHLGAGQPEEQPQNDFAEDSTVPFEPLTEGAMDFPNMKEIDPSESAYDPRLEAQQAFSPMEEDLLAADPLGPEAWREALEKNKLRNAGVSKRAQYLRESGHPEFAEDLIAEWGRVYGTWQARAYGRAGPPGYKSPQR